jgi:hypothetical protein
VRDRFGNRVGRRQHRDQRATQPQLCRPIHDAPHWQLTMAQLIDAAEGRNFIMHARIAVLRALNHGLPDPKTEPRRKAVKKHRIIR